MGVQVVLFTIADWIANVYVAGFVESIVLLTVYLNATEGKFKRMTLKRERGG